MPYVEAVTVVRKGREVVVEITETGALTGSEPTAIGLKFARGVLLRATCVLTAGTGPSVDPVLGTVTDPGASANAASVVYANGTAAATVDYVPSTPIPFHTSTGELFHRSVPSGGSDNAITTKYFIRVGWND